MHTHHTHPHTHIQTHDYINTPTHVVHVDAQTHTCMHAHTQNMHTHMHTVRIKDAHKRTCKRQSIRKYVCRDPSG